MPLRIATLPLIAILLVFSFNEAKSLSVFSGFSLNWYRELFRDAETLGAARNTLVLALCAAVISTVMGTAAAVGINKLRNRAMRAAMDTVTEADLAIAMARAGGIGVIHKNMPIEKQCEQVRHVKRAENGMIYDPVTISPDATVGNALAMMKKHHIGGIPVVDGNGFLIGIVTNRDLRFQEDMQLPISQVMTRENLVTAPKGITLAEATRILQHSKVEKLPVVDGDGKLVGLITYKDLMKIKDNPIASKDSKGRLLVAAAAGIKSDTIERIGMLIDAGADAVVLDTAHGHSEGVLQMIRKACDAYKDFQIIAGNVATGAGAKALAEAGVKAVKVGIGPGSICTTRIIAGIGVPQLCSIASSDPMPR